MIRLTCPLCGTLIADDREPEIGERCPGCRGVVLGGGDDPVSGVAAALEQEGREEELPIAPIAQALFALAAPDPRAALVAITSDERDGFYRWWVVLRDDEGDVLGSLRPDDSA